MQLDDWLRIACALALGAGSGLLFWATARGASALASRWPKRSPFAADLLAESGHADRQRYRDAGSELAALLGGILVAAIATATNGLLLARQPLPAMPAWLLIVAGIAASAVLLAGVYLAVRVQSRRRRLAFAWAANAAVGNVLKRLNATGNRVFHAVRVEGAVIDHVVAGTKGVFAVNVVARRVPRDVEGRAAAELRNGKLWMAGNVEAMPVGDAARNMTLLAAALGRLIGHRVAVRSVLAVPGWQTMPNGGGHHLVLNENNLVMLPSWNPPEAYLMDEDFRDVQKFLAEASRVRG